MQGLELLNSHLKKAAIGAAGGAASALLYNSVSYPVKDELGNIIESKDISPLNAAIAGGLIGVASEAGRNYFSKMQNPIAQTPTVQQPVNQRQYTHGWKLHLNVDDQYIPSVSSELDLIGFPYKAGKNSGQKGKSMTVYVGSKNDAVIVANRLAQNQYIKPPAGDVLVDDALIAGNIWGRFDMPRENKDWHQYGFNGVPLKKDHWEVLRYGDSSLKQQFVNAAHQELIDLYGDFYTGS